MVRSAHRIWALLSKELQELRTSPALFMPAVTTGVIAILLPFVVAIMIPSVTGERLSSSSEFRAVVESDQYALNPEGAVQAYLFQRFLILLVLAPVAGAMTVAAHAVVGEKQARTLEPLLVTPLTTFELLFAKILGALLPAGGLVVVCFGLYLAGVATTAEAGVLGTLLVPRSLLTIFLFAPLASLAALQLTVCVSVRVNDVRGAQQIGALIIMPISGLMVAELAGYIDIDASTVMLLSAALATVNAVLMVVAVGLFDRESILTRWK